MINHTNLPLRTKSPPRHRSVRTGGLGTAHGTVHCFKMRNDPRTVPPGVSYRRK